jgi:hypothetical protein
VAEVISDGRMGDIEVQLKLAQKYNVEFDPSR